jgi:hypothetical protein
MKLAIKSSIEGVALAVLFVLAMAGMLPWLASADQIPAGWKASNMKPIGYSNLNGHGGFKMAIRRVGDLWFLYMGHLWETGWTVVDVTDPANPKVARNWSIGDNSGSAQIDLQGNLAVTALAGIPWGWDASKPHQQGVAFWDISDPVNPELLSKWLTPGGTHRNTYLGGKYVYLAAYMPGYKGRILVILDLSDPKHPKEAGRWWMQGQKEGEQTSAPLLDEVAPPGGHGADPTFHGGITFDGNTAYLGYTPALVILDVSDPTHPRQIGRLDFSPPFNGIVVHDALKIPGRPLVFVHAEALGGDTEPGSPYRRTDDLPSCGFSVPLAGMVDVSIPAHPRLISMLPVPEPPPGEPYTDFCDKGGRFGPHNTNLLQHLPDVEKQADLIYLTYFNAGLRIFNIHDPRLPKEVGWFIPPPPTKRIGPVPAKLTTSTEDVLVDTRGNIYITDKQWGLFVLRYTGQGEPAPTAN